MPTALTKRLLLLVMWLKKLALDIRSSDASDLWLRSSLILGNDTYFAQATKGLGVESKKSAVAVM
jgi:hypothetical protein